MSPEPRKLNSLELLAEVALNQISTQTNIINTSIENQRINGTSSQFVSNGLLTSVPSLLVYPATSSLNPVQPTTGSSVLIEPIHQFRFNSGQHTLPGIVSGRFINPDFSGLSGVTNSIPGVFSSKPGVLSSLSGVSSSISGVSSCIAGVFSSISGVSSSVPEVHLSRLGPIHQNENDLSPDLEQVSQNASSNENSAGPSSSSTYTHPESDQAVSSSKEELSCPICGRIASKISSLNNHMRTMHGFDKEGNEKEKEKKERKYQCKICLKMFHRKSNVTEHVKRVHENQAREYKRSFCRRCGKGFARQNSCNQHKSRCITTIQSEPRHIALRISIN